MENPFTVETAVLYLSGIGVLGVIIIASTYKLARYIFGSFKRG